MRCLLAWVADEKHVGDSNIKTFAQGNSRQEFFLKANCSAMPWGKKKVNPGPNLTLNLAWVYPR